jgi:hypothetical protein
MQLYIFSSSNLTNIWAGIGARMWAVSEMLASNPAAISRAEQLPLGAFGMLYCVEKQSFTVPFVVRSRPDIHAVVREVWPEPWRLPFQIIPLGSPRRQMSKDELGSRLPAFSRSGQPWTHTFHIQPATAFAPSEVDDGDWQVLVGALADA